MILAQEVVVTNTLNITTILAIISAVGLLGGAAVTVIFKLIRQVQKELQEMRLQSLADQNALLAAQVAQTHRLEQCIHRMPGHPENPENVVNS